jgi:hypothetical protein
VHAPSSRFGHADPSTATMPNNHAEWIGVISPLERAKRLIM